MLSSSLTWGGIGRWVDFDVGVGVGGGLGGGKLVEDCAGEGEVVRLQGDERHDLGKYSIFQSPIVVKLHSTGLPLLR